MKPNSLLSFALFACVGLPGTAFAAPEGPVAITDVRVFHGGILTAPQTVVIENGKIVSLSGSSGSSGPVTDSIDGRGGTLLPGLIDAHMHLEGEASLAESARWGVTTVLDMGTRDLAEINRLRGMTGVADLMSCGNSVAPAGSTHAAIGCAVVQTPMEAKDYIMERVRERVDYIKVIVDSPSSQGLAVLDKAVLTALVEEAHRNGLKVIAHVTAYDSLELCRETGVDVLTHIPLGSPVDTELAQGLAEAGAVATPTLDMMRYQLESFPPEVRAQGMDYANAERSLAALHAAGVTIIAGTDANTSVCMVPHGESLHTELKLMVDAGMTPVDVLNSATAAAAGYYGLSHRGVIEPGKRADLLLVEGDPTANITATRNIVGVWIAGQRIR